MGSSPEEVILPPIVQREGLRQYRFKESFSSVEEEIDDLRAPKRDGPGVFPSRPSKLTIDIPESSNSMESMELEESKRSHHCSHTHIKT